MSQDVLALPLSPYDLASDLFSRSKLNDTLRGQSHSFSDEEVDRALACISKRTSGQTEQTRSLTHRHVRRHAAAGRHHTAKLSSASSVNFLPARIPELHVGEIADRTLSTSTRGRSATFGVHKDYVAANVGGVRNTTNLRRSSALRNIPTAVGEGVNARVPPLRTAELEDVWWHVQESRVQHMPPPPILDPYPHSPFTSPAPIPGGAWTEGRSSPSTTSTHPSDDGDSGQVYPGVQASPQHPRHVTSRASSSHPYASPQRNEVADSRARVLHTFARTGSRPGSRPPLTTRSGSSLPSGQRGEGKTFRRFSDLPPLSRRARDALLHQYGAQLATRRGQSGQSGQLGWGTRSMSGGLWDAWGENSREREAHHARMRQAASNPVSMIPEHTRERNQLRTTILARHRQRENLYAAMPGPQTYDR